MMADPIRIEKRGPLQWWVFYPDGGEAGPYLFRWMACVAAKRGTRRT